MEEESSLEVSQSETSCTVCVGLRCSWSVSAQTGGMTCKLLDALFTCVRMCKYM